MFPEEQKYFNFIHTNTMHSFRDRDSGRYRRLRQHGIFSVDKIDRFETVHKFFKKIHLVSAFLLMNLPN